MTSTTNRRATIILAGLALLLTGGAGGLWLGVPAASTVPSVHYKLFVAPGGDPQSIHLDVDRAERLEIDAAGNLVIRAGGRTIHHTRPRAFQHVNGIRRNVDARFEFTPTGELRLALDEYDRSRAVTIVPVF